MILAAMVVAGLPIGAPGALAHDAEDPNQPEGDLSPTHSTGIVDESHDAPESDRIPEPPWGDWQSIETDSTVITQVRLRLWSQCTNSEPIRLVITPSSSPHLDVLADVDGPGHRGNPNGDWVTFDFPDFKVWPGRVLYLHFQFTQQTGTYDCWTWVEYSDPGAYSKGQSSWSASGDALFEVYGDHWPQDLSEGSWKQDYLHPYIDDDRRYFRFTIPPGQDRLTVTMDGPSGQNFDLFVLHGGWPGEFVYTCRGISTDADESCSVTSPGSSGNWYAMARRVSGYGYFNIKYDLEANAAPHQPSNPSPFHGASGISASGTTLSWSSGDPDGDTVSHTVYMEAWDSTPDTHRCSTNANSCGTGSLAYGTTYYWKVVASDDELTSTSPVWSFTTQADPNNAPRTPNTPTPAHGATGISPDGTTLRWNGGDPDGDITRYTVYLEQGDSSPDIIRCNGTYTTECATGPLTVGARYHWKVVASDGSRTTTGPTWSFDVRSNSPPATPSLPSPGHGATGISPAGTTLGWSGGDANGDTVRYTVYLERGDSTPDTVRCSGTTQRSCATGGLTTASTYYWKVVADDGYTQTTGPTWRFTTRDNSAPTAAFTWTGSHTVASFDASGSSDPDGDTLSYGWSFGDGQTGTGRTTSHDYWRSCPGGTFDVTLTVTDPLGASDSTTTQVTVQELRDGDGDGLLHCHERLQGTSDGNKDTDDDGLNDYVESTEFGFRDWVFCRDGMAFLGCAYPRPTLPDLYIEVDWYDGSKLPDSVVSAVHDTFVFSPRVPGIRVVIDDGSLGGGQQLTSATGYVSWDEMTANYNADFANERKGIFHYAVIACADPEGMGGYGRSPGDRFSVYRGRDPTCNSMDSEARTTNVFLHELGHNLLGLRYDRSHADDGHPNCKRNAVRANSDIDSTWTHIEDDPRRNDCNGDGAADTWSHSDDPDALMSGYSLSGDEKYTDNTWQAMRLYMSVGDRAPSCSGSPVTLDPSVESAISTALEPVGTPCHIATPHGDKPAPPPLETKTNEPTAHDPTPLVPILPLLAAMVLGIRRRR